MKQAVCVLVCAAFIAWNNAHTKEIPVVLGFVLMLSAILGLAFPRRPWLTGLLMGAPVFLAKMSAGLPWLAVLGFVPAMGGAFFGSAVRHLNAR